MGHKPPSARAVAPDAVATASGINVSAFNLGISCGSFIGGRVVEGPARLDRDALRSNRHRCSRPRHHHPRRQI
jgi:DHA1 family inner membrane transport protein